MDKINILIQAIDKKKQELDSCRPLPKPTLVSLQNWFNVELAYTSNAIEGSTLTRSETTVVIQDGLTIGGKSLKEHLEAINHSFAFDYIKELAKKSISEIRLQDIKDVHQLILRTIDDKNAGVWRKVPVAISGSDVKLADPLKIQELMNEFVLQLHTCTSHAAICAAEAHFKMVAIHPFIDGNGRTARLVMNLILMHHGFPPAIIYPDTRAQYISSLEVAHKTKNLNDFNTIVLTAIEKGLDKYLEYCS